MIGIGSVTFQQSKFNFFFVQEKDQNRNRSTGSLTFILHLLLLHGEKCLPISP
jgi:hypothetical protein